MRTRSIAWSTVIFGGAAGITAALSGLHPVADAAGPLVAAVAARGQDPAMSGPSSVPGWQYAGVAARTVLHRAPALSRDRSRAAEPAHPAPDDARTTGWMLPVSAGSYRLTARFGDCSTLWAHCHTGLDFAADSGTPVRAVDDGAITSTGWAGAYGYRTVETLADGTELWYCHQDSFSVSAGDAVEGGNTIGAVGATGNVTGPHLHVEVRPGGGDPVDPYAALVAHGLTP